VTRPVYYLGHTPRQRLKTGLAGSKTVGLGAHRIAEVHAPSRWMGLNKDTQLTSGMCP
jgi:hypothetical protein